MTPEREVSVKSGAAQMEHGKKKAPEQEAGVKSGVDQVVYGKKGTPEQEVSVKPVVRQMMRQETCPKREYKKCQKK